MTVDPVLETAIAAPEIEPMLVELNAMGLLRHHKVDAPVSRGALSASHTTAVMREQATGRRWAVDAWTHNSGERPDILPIEVWSAQS